MTQETRSDFFSLKARPWTRGLFSAMLGGLLAVAPVSAVAWMLDRDIDASTALLFGDGPARLVWWLAAIAAHLALLVAVMLMTNRRAASRTIMAITLGILALLLDGAATAYLWITFMLAHPHGL